MRKVTWQATQTAEAVFPELAGREVSASGGAEARAHAMLERAEGEAQALMEAARQKAQALMEAGHREGMLQGRAEALAEARGALQGVMQNLMAACDRLRALEAECRTGADDLVVTLALALAERILHAETLRDPAAILGVVRGALALVPAPDEVVIRIHPDAAALVQAHREALRDAGPTGSVLRIVGDSTVAGGGCLVETPHAVIDATFPAQLAEARRRLLEEPW
jgi:flagellar assembly protein FliH